MRATERLRARLGPLRERLGPLLRPLPAAELFAFGNLGFLAVDVYLAHSYNAFAHPAEWVPVLFSALSPIWLIAVWLLARRGLARESRVPGIALGAASIVVGVAGMVLHLESAFFVERTLKSLVYAAPFVGPLAYAGVGLLIVLNRLVDEDDPSWGRWVVMLALGGFVGNFVLALVDHAQSGFFDWREWIAVISAGFGVSFLTLVVLRPEDALLRRITFWLMLVQMVVGVAGFFLHLLADVRGPMGTLWENVIYGAPPFAPLLFPDMAILALIGLWSLGRTIPRERPAPKAA